MARFCSRYSRPVRGVLGGVIGATVAGLVGGGIMLAIISRADPDSPSSAFPALVPVVFMPLVGLGLGAYLGARKPEC